MEQFINTQKLQIEYPNSVITLGYFKDPKQLMRVLNCYQNNNTGNYRIIIENKQILNNSKIIF